MRIKQPKQAPEDPSGRVPPGQFVTEKFPVLSAGPSPRVDLAQWRFRIYGLVTKEMELTWERLMALPQVTVTADFHCVTQWSRLGNTWRGVASKAVLELAAPARDARYIMVHCYGGYTTNLDLETLWEQDALFAHEHDGQPLAPDHGGPLRLVVPRRYGWKSAKWVSGLELLAEDRPGFWEQRGYHLRGDPWREQRFWDELA